MTDQVILYRGQMFENANQMAQALGCGRGAIYKALTKGRFHGFPIMKVERDTTEPGAA